MNTSSHQSVERQYLHRLMAEATNPQNMPETLTTTADYAVTFGFMDEAARGSLADTIAAHEAVNITLAGVTTPEQRTEPNFNGKLLEELGAASLIPVKIYDTAQVTTRNARSFAGLVHELDAQNKAPDGAATPIVEYARMHGHNPYEVLIRTLGVTKHLLRSVEGTLAYMSLVTVDRLRKRPPSSPRVRNSIHANRPRPEDPRIEVAEMALGIAKNPLTKLEACQALELGRFVVLYQEWRSTAQSVQTKLIKLPPKLLMPEAKQSRAGYRPLERQPVVKTLAEAQAEVDELLADHASKIATLRASWSKKLRTEFRPLSNELVRLGMSGSGFPAPTSKEGKRFTIILYNLASLGKEPEETLRSTFHNTLRAEAQVAEKLEQLLSSLQHTNVRPDTTTWSPVGADLDILVDCWQTLEPLLREQWPEGDKAAATARIAQALTAYTIYKDEQPAEIAQAKPAASTRPAENSEPEA